jgi:glycosyltransferase involved in cell wall biosynthesis
MSFKFKTRANRRSHPVSVPLVTEFRGLPPLPRAVVQVAYGGMSGIRHVVVELTCGLRAKGVSSDLILYQRGVDAGEADLDYEAASSLRVVAKESRLDFWQLIKLSLEIERNPASAAIHHGAVVALIHSAIWRVRGRIGPVPILVHHNPIDGLSWTQRVIELFASRLAHTNVVVGSNCLPDVSLRSHRIFASQPVRINNPVGCRSYSSVNGIPRDRAQLNVTMVGRMVRQKDFITLIRAVQLVDQDPEGPIIHLHIAGNGPDLQSIRSAIGQLGSEIVTLHGELPYQDALSLIASSDIYVQSSRFEADPSTSVLFAMFNSVPVVVADVPGIRDEFKFCEPTPVEVFSCGEAGQLGSRLKRLASDPAWRTELGGRGKSFVTERNSCEMISESWLELLGSIDSWRGARS